ncbi:MULTISPECIES: NADP-dependent oxidoreductase [unclassified Herbaspirillum]|uniref:NADP-dependent oxidoreductase n=1 Tax=unclassified Herbaspirillum TaxID=2624150 RepID=UPI000E2F6358|nr:MULTISPECIES: NADP-dependent oxidoreductase [unclassified Herbaspirillum]RFB65773.1 NADP-dependent oxidoreductase [Herbaspirillum sp. 3R-3a1]TFI08921.1 NADP-dependent oxidoreductase [Herbaspirillum sp. 3R11]TFI15339.1 NADP-dependent oxidoreductase [Herbaspirillum sp. 3R-11]TFI24132.1 NADP-dependent oxidoreductase [Herbaspirillum sp. 3C11]
MPQRPLINRRIVLARRPDGAPLPRDFRLEEAAIPVPAAGQLLLQTVYLSLDPYMRGRMSDAASYAPPLALGEVMVGGTVSRVVVSRHSQFREGDLVLSFDGWQEYALSDGSDLTPLGDAAHSHPSHALSVLGMPGFTAYHALLKIGQPKAGETVVVAAASGAVGSVLGQIAKIKGACVVGIAGGADKCRYVEEELGFDVCIDRRDPDFARKLAAACPDGIDIYHESVGGPVFDAVLPLLNDHARIPVSGSIAHYNEKGLPAGPDRLPQLLSALVFRRIRVQGFIILDHYTDGHAEFQRDMRAWVADGRVKLREDIVAGLEHAPAALIGLLDGRNFGKVVVRVAD